jgi:hypothetical protein
MDVQRTTHKETDQDLQYRAARAALADRVQKTSKPYRYNPIDRNS